MNVICTEPLRLTMVLLRSSCAIMYWYIKVSCDRVSDAASCRRSGLRPGGNPTGALTTTHPVKEIASWLRLMLAGRGGPFLEKKAATDWTESPAHERVDAALGGMIESLALLECAGRLLDDDEQAANETVCLRFGLTLFNQSYNELDLAIRELKEAARQSKVVRPKGTTNKKRSTAHQPRRPSRKAK